MVNKQEIEFIKITNINQAVGKNKLYCLKLPNENSFSLIVTDLNGVRVPLKDLQGSGGITSILNTDGNLVVAGNVINISPSLLATINSALTYANIVSALGFTPANENDLEEFVINETPIGLLNGSNAVFTAQFGVKPDSEEVYINGNRQKKPDDYNISGQVITLTFSPQSTESILIGYIKI